MNFRFLAIASMVILLTAGLVRAADKYEVDPVHSSIVFKVVHMETGEFWGRFNKVSGSFEYDEADPGKSKMTFSVPMDSLDTNHPKRDADLKGPDFFSAKEFKEITFNSTEIKKSGDKKLEVTGQLTMHGQSKPITVTINMRGPNDTRQG